VCIVLLLFVGWPLSAPFDYLLKQRTTPRTDCPMTLPDVPLADPAVDVAQGERPLVEVRRAAARAQHGDALPPRPLLPPLRRVACMRRVVVVVRGRVIAMRNGVGCAGPSQSITPCPLQALPWAHTMPVGHCCVC
jgi:hypothetical protein